MPWYLYLALKQLFPSGRKRPSLFFLISVLGVTLGVMILIIVQSVMGGFGYMHREKMVLTSGHIDVRANGNVLHNEEELLQIIRSHDEVDASVPYAQGIVMLTYNDRPAFPYIYGVDITQPKQVIPLGSLLLDGSMDDMDDDSVMLSVGLAQTVHANVGDTVEVYTPLMLDKLKQDEVLLPRELRIAGIFETGWNPVDTNTIVGTLRLVQDLYDLGDDIHGVSIRLKKDNDELVFKLTQELNTELPGRATAHTWMDLNRDFLWILALEKNMMLFLLLFIVLVAAFAITMAQLLTVLRKTREIGLLGAMGARPRHLAAMYCFQGFFIGLLGVILGIAVAVTALEFRDPLVEGMANLTQSRAALVQFYQFAHLPVHYAVKDFVVVSVATLCISTLAGLIPALRAAFMKPAEALRSE